jgi:membrane protein DedA with SNARE-associated domain
MGLFPKLYMLLLLYDSVMCGIISGIRCAQGDVRELILWAILGLLFGIYVIYYRGRFTYHTILLQKYDGNGEPSGYDTVIGVELKDGIYRNRSADKK